MAETGEQIDFFSLTPRKLAELLKEEFDLPSYRADQIYQWVYKRGLQSFGEMTNLAVDLRPRLNERFSFPRLEIANRQISRDGTRKYLFRCRRGDLVESVMIKQPFRMTLCVSSQVGCAMGCTFCQTGTMGLKRNLKTSEIIGQVLGVIEDAKQFGDMFSNIVFMGMGEPLHNLSSLIDAIQILQSDFAMNLSPRKITISTSGLVPQIKKFAASGVDACLAISLNATTDEVRSKIMPVNRRFPIAELLSALKEIPVKPRRVHTIEYVMLHGVNDSKEDLQRLPKLLKGVPSKVNLIPYNFNSGLGFSPPPIEWVHHWQSELNRAGVFATVRWSKGIDIAAACGQLVTESAQSRDSVSV